MLRQSALVDWEEELNQIHTQACKVKAEPDLFAYNTPQMCSSIYAIVLELRRMTCLVVELCVADCWIPTSELIVIFPRYQQGQFVFCARPCSRNVRAVADSQF